MKTNLLKLKRKKSILEDSSNLTAPKEKEFFAYYNVQWV